MVMRTVIGRRFRDGFLHVLDVVVFVINAAEEHLVAADKGIEVVLLDLVIGFLVPGDGHFAVLIGLDDPEAERTLTAVVVDLAVLGTAVKLCLELGTGCLELPLPRRQDVLKIDVRPLGGVGQFAVQLVLQTVGGVEVGVERVAADDGAFCDIVGNAFEVACLNVIGELLRPALTFVVRLLSLPVHHRRSRSKAIHWYSSSSRENRL